MTVREKEAAHNNRPVFQEAPAGGMQALSGGNTIQKNAGNDTREALWNLPVPLPAFIIRRMPWGSMQVPG